MLGSRRVGFLRQPLTWFGVCLDWPVISAFYRRRANFLSMLPRCWKRSTNWKSLLHQLRLTSLRCGCFSILANCAGRTTTRVWYLPHTPPDMAQCLLMVGATTRSAEHLG